MSVDLAGQSILVTGAGRGLGRSVAEHLARCGAVLGVVDIDAAAVEETAARIRAGGGIAHAYEGDVSRREAVLDIAARFAAAAGGRIDAVVNNAMLLRYEPVEAVREDVIDRMLSIGIKGTIWGTQALLAHMDPARGGTIINMASPVGERGFANTSIYSAVKGAVATVTRTLAAELGPRGVRVNAVAPASVPTPGALGIVAKEEYARRSATIPLRRIGSEEDNANGVAFLLSREAAFITGEILHVDGGVVAAG